MNLSLILVKADLPGPVIRTNMVKRSESWRTRSLLSRFAHVVERTGLALAGGSCGLFVAAHVARSDFNLISSGVAIAAMMIYGAAGFYLGIDLPPHAVSSIILDEIARSGNAATILSGWFAGASMQIARHHRATARGCSLRLNESARNVGAG